MIFTRFQRSHVNRERCEGSTEFSGSLMCAAARFSSEQDLPCSSHAESSSLELPGMQRNAEPKENLQNPKQVIQASHEAAFWLVSPMTETSALQSFEALTASYPESKGSWNAQGCVHCHLIFKKVLSSSARIIQTYVLCDKYQQGLVISAKLYKRT